MPQPGCCRLILGCFKLLLPALYPYCTVLNQVLTISMCTSQGRSAIPHAQRVKLSSVQQQRSLQIRLLGGEADAWPAMWLRRGRRNAGETKGVTMEENKKHLAMLRQLLARPENKACADCASSSAGGRPTWASINTGAFICMRCAGIHRGLGVHVSKVGTHLLGASVITMHVLMCVLLDVLPSVTACYSFVLLSQVQR